MAYKKEKEETELRTHMYPIRLKEGEFQAIMKKAKSVNSSMANYMIRCALNKEIKPLLDIKLLMELNKIGVNINQIAHVVNASGSFPTTSNDLSELNKLLIEIRSIVNNSK